MKKAHLFLSATLIIVTGIAQAEDWTITEGPKGEWSGRWTISLSNPTFSCSQKSGSQVLTANCTVIKSGKLVAVRKTDVSDGNPCNYFGEKSGNTITGTYFCKNGGPYSWTAVVSE